MQDFKPGWTPETHCDQCDEETTEHYCDDCWNAWKYNDDDTSGDY
jgi:hypothetical protein